MTTWKPDTANVNPIDRGVVRDGAVTLPNIFGPGDRPGGEPPTPDPPGARVGFAIVGLGRLSLEEILPAFAQCRRARPVALVSGSPEKARAVGAQYGIAPDALYDYDSFDRIAENPAIEAVYIVLPNALHRPFVERGAAAGKAILCEKPLATGAADARAMIAACAAARVKLMVAYRCQYEPYNRAVIDLARGGDLGGLRLIEANNSQSQGVAEQWRHRLALAGGGVLPDIGLYCLNGARAIVGEEPIEVFARTYSPPDDPRFREVEERIAFTLRFPSGVMAQCAGSYDAHNTKDLRVRLERGWIALDDAFAYHGKRLTIGRRVSDEHVVEEHKLREENQFALEIDHFAACIRDGGEPRTPGEEGLRDHIIIDALYESAHTGAPIALSERLS